MMGNSWHCLALYGNLQEMSHNVAIESKYIKIIQKDATCLWRFAAIFMLFPAKVQRCWRKDWKIMGNHKYSQTIPNISQTYPNIPKPSTSESFHQHPPTSTNPTKQPQCHEYPQVAHSLMQSPWVPSACRCRSPLPPDENEECAEPLAWYSSGMLREVHVTYWWVIYCILWHCVAIFKECRIWHHMTIECYRMLVYRIKIYQNDSKCTIKPSAHILKLLQKSHEQLIRVTTKTTNWMGGWYTAIKSKTNENEWNIMKMNGT